MKIVPFALERYFAQHEFTARHVLCASDCESFSVDELLALAGDARERFATLRLGYTETVGAPPLRRAIASLYDSITPDCVLVHAGAQEAIFTFVNSVLRPGDHVIVHTPCYQSLTEVARAIGCKVSAWQADERNGWDLDLGALRRMLRRETRVIILNTPHNPTGHLMRREKFEAIVDIARQRKIVLFSDEVYRLLEHDPLDTLPAACDLNENAVSLGVMSKAFGLAGLRIGWVATQNRRVLDAMAAFKDYTSICSSAPSEFLAALALEHRGAILARNRAIIRRNLDLLDTFFARHKDRFTWQRPKAGTTAFPALRGRRTASRFCDELLRREGVLLAPGPLFDHDDRHFRLGFGRTDLAAALWQVEQFVGTRESRS